MTPTIEIVAIGTELLKGSIVNTNSAEIAKALVSAGYRTLRQTVLPDERTLLQEGLKEALQRSGIVIATGGLGPTCDDVTRQAAAALFNSEFAFNESIAEELKRRYGKASASIADQASVPIKAQILPNPIGTACGLVFSEGSSTLILIPGVPKEMRAMLQEQVLAYLAKAFPPPPPLKSRSSHFFGLSESSVDPFLRELEAAYPDIEFGIYPSHGVLAVSATEKQHVAKNSSRLCVALDKLKEHFPLNYFGADGERLEDLLQHRFIDKGWTLATAESCTGGAIAARLTKVPGASNYFAGGVVAYTNELKERVLNVPGDLIARFGAVSEETVKAMAEGVLALTGANFSLSVSGVAGPTGGSDDKPVGTVWIGIAGRGRPTAAYKIRGFGNREMVIETAVNLSLGHLLKFTD